MTNDKIAVKCPNSDAAAFPYQHRKFVATGAEASAQRFRDKSAEAMASKVKNRNQPY